MVQITQLVVVKHHHLQLALLTVLDIDQVGNSNVITYKINGATYTGTINLVGNSNDVDLNCDSTGNNGILWNCDCWYYNDW